MKQFPFGAWFGFVLIAVTLVWSSFCPSLAMHNQLKHVVILKFKQSASTEQIARIARDFSRLKSKIPLVVNIEWGTNVSPENLAQGYTHCFLVTFKNSTDRDAYLVHPVHKEFVQELLPLAEQVFVIDFNTDHSGAAK